MTSNVSVSTTRASKAARLPSPDDAVPPAWYQYCQRLEYVLDCGVEDENSSCLDAARRSAEAGNAAQAWIGQRLECVHVCPALVGERVGACLRACDW